MRRALITILSSVTLAVLGAPGAAHAVTWTELASGTGDEITAVEYQSADRFWFATGNGKIYKRVGGTFEKKFDAAGVVFKDIEFQDGGQIGFAVGNNGTVLRSANAGDSWTSVGTLTGGRRTQENNCTAADETLGDVDSVRFAGSSRAWIVAGGTQIFRTVSGATPTNVGTNAAGWQYINDNGATCKVSEDVDDLLPVPGSDAVYFVAKGFGTIYFTSNALDTESTTKSGSGGNGFERRRRLAGDPGNPNRQWSVAPNGTGGSYYGRTDDGWSSADGWDLKNSDSGGFTRAEDVDALGGTVLAVGSGGMIVVSVDGANFYVNPSGGGVATQDWRSVSMASGTAAAVGGVGGKLVVTTDANTIPDIVEPTATISGPVTVAAGTPATFTANAADNAGGSGINPASFVWTATGTAGATTNPATLTFPSAGLYTVRVAFRDNAGNPGSATLSVNATVPQVIGTPPPPQTPPTTVSKTKTITQTVAGGTVSLGAPRVCVPPNTTFTATLKFKKSKRKGALFVKVSSVEFFVDGKKQGKTDKKAPFSKKLSVTKLKAGTKHTLRARATVKVKRGKSPKKSITTSFTVCR